MGFQAFKTPKRKRRAWSGRRTSVDSQANKAILLATAIQREKDTSRRLILAFSSATLCASTSISITRVGRQSFADIILLEERVSVEGLSPWHRLLLLAKRSVVLLSCCPAVLQVCLSPRASICSAMASFQKLLVVGCLCAAHAWVAAPSKPLQTRFSIRTLPFLDAR
jgi:hypothetical protein